MRKVGATLFLTASAIAVATAAASGSSAGARTAAPMHPVAVTSRAPAFALDITGKWLFNVQLDAGTGTPTVTFKQEGEKLTGHYSSQTLGELDFTGTLKEKALAFKLKGDMGGQAIEVTYSGTVTDSVSMKGTVDFGGMASGTFTGKKQ